MLIFFKKIRFIHIFWALFYCLVFFVLLKNSLASLDPDLGWHLKVGQEIAGTYQVPRASLYNYSYTGQWVDHEWLADFSFFEIYSHFNYLTLAIISGLIITLLFILLNISSGRKIQSSLAGIISIAGLQLLGLFAALPYFGVRIQIIVPLFIFAELMIIRKYDKWKKTIYLIWLIPLFFVWSNLHGSFLLGIFILFAWVAVRWFEKTFLFKGEKNNLVEPDSVFNKRQLLIFLGFALLVFLATLLTPYKLELYSFLAGYQNTAYLSYLKEWRSQFAYPLNSLELSYIFSVSVLIFYYFYFLIFKKNKKIDFWDTFLALLFIFLGFKSRRHLPLFITATFAPSIVALTILISSAVNRLQWYLKSRLIMNLLKFSAAFYLIVLISSQINNIQIFSNPFSYFSLNYPYDALNYLKSNPEYVSGNIFNNYDWGGYLVWNYPEKQIFIDGRFPQMKFAGHTLLEEYLVFFDSDKIIEQKLLDYRISLVLIANKKENGALSRYLELNKNWKLVYSDPVSLCFYRSILP